MKRNWSCLRLVPISIALLTFTFLSGCWDARELANLAIVGGIGIDRDNKTGRLLLTAQIIKPGDVKSGGGGEAGQSSGKGGGQQAFLLVRSSGKTVAEGIHNFTFQLNREVYLSHNPLIIFGKDLATHGVRPVIDYFVRTRETRETSWIIIAKGKASDILEARVGMEKIPTMEISGLIQERGIASESSGIIQQEFVNRLMSKSTAPYASLMEASGESKKVRLIGTAVFKRDKLAGELNRIETRGFLWVIGKVEHGGIPVKLPHGELVDFEILKSQSKVIPQLTAGAPSFEIAVTCQFGITSESKPEDLTQMKTMDRLARFLKGAIGKEIRSAILKAAQLDCDIFGFGEAIHRKYPKAWKRLESQWDRIFSQIPVQLRLKVKLVELGLNTKPVAPQE